MRPAPRRMTTIFITATLVTAGLASGVAAQSPSASPGVAPTCDVLTAEEVSAALGETLTVTTGGQTDCEFDSDYASGTFLSLYTSIAPGSVEEIKSVMCSSFGATTPPSVAPSTAPCAIDVQIAGQPGVFMPQAMSTVLYVQPSAGSLFDLELVGDPAATVDKQTALTGLAEQALPRLSSMPLPTVEPVVAAPSLTPDKDLEALFPTQVAGLPVTVQSFSGNDAASSGSVPDALTQALAAQGKTINDVSIGYGSYIDPTTNTSGVISALRVKGLDVSSMTAVLMPLVLNGQTPVSQTQAQIGGKDVTVVKATADTPDDQLQYFYTKNDVLWVVQAAEPGLTEIFTGLP